MSARETLARALIEHREGTTIDAGGITRLATNFDRAEGILARLSAAGYEVVPVELASEAALRCDVELLELLGDERDPPDDTAKAAWALLLAAAKESSHDNGQI